MNELSGGKVLVMQHSVLPVKNSNNGHNSGTSLILGLKCWKPFFFFFNRIQQPQISAHVCVLKVEACPHLNLPYFSIVYVTLKV